MFKCDMCNNEFDDDEKIIINSSDWECNMEETFYVCPECYGKIRHYINTKERIFDL